VNFLINENKYFTIEHCYSCVIPGYLIVSPKVNVISISDLPRAFQQHLGSSLAAATEVVRKIVNPVKVYCAQFGEEKKELHFHIFPRTLKITSEFLKTYPEQEQLIHGPTILDWARLRYKGDRDSVWSIVSSVVLEMRERITNTPSTQDVINKPATIGLK